MLRTFYKNSVTADAEVLPDEWKVRIRIRPIPGNLRWSRPDSAALRKLADDTIKESGYPSWQRLGRAMVFDTDTGWNVHYNVGD